MIIPFISVNKAYEAIEYYKEVFNAHLAQEVTMLNHIPGFEDPIYKGKVSHATLVISGSTIFINDIVDKKSKTIGDNIQLVLDFETEEAIRNIFSLISSEGEVIEALHEAHWARMFGTVKDKFGIVWQMYYGHK